MIDWKRIPFMKGEVGQRDPSKYDDKWVVEIKYDGARKRIIGKESMIGTGFKDSRFQFPEIMPSIDAINEDVVLEGEMVVLDKNGLPNFESLQSRDKCTLPLPIKINSKREPATLFLFDVLKYGEEEVWKKPLIERRKYLEKLKDYETERMKVVEQFPSTMASEMIEECQRLKTEGLMFKHINGPYEFRVGSKDWRSGMWLKCKMWEEVDLPMLGYTTNGRGIEALVTPNGRVAFSVSDRLRGHYLKVISEHTTEEGIVEYLGKKEKCTQVSSGIILKIKYLEFHSNGTLRNPSLKELV